MSNTLVSPGVSISIIDQSINVSSGPGTVPLIFITTQENKTDPSGSTIAPGTLKANAGKVYTITSQRDLVNTFGDPVFYQVSGSQINGYPLNEYGLLSAYSFLGISNVARVVRADIDLAQMQPSSVVPSSPASIGTLWLDQSATGTKYGLFTRSGVFPNETWTAVTPKFNYDFATGTSNVPVSSDGVDGDLATVFETASGQLSYWIKVGSSWSHFGVETFTSSNTATSSGTTITVNSTSNLRVGMQVYVQSGTGTIAAGTRITAITSGTTFTVSTAPTVALSAAVITAGFEAVFQTVWPDLTSASTGQQYWVKTTSAAQGANMVLRVMDATTNAFVQVESPVLLNDTASDAYYSTSITGSNGRYYAKLAIAGTSVTVNALQFRIGTASSGAWSPVGSIIGSASVVTNGPSNGELWFNPTIGLDSTGKSTIDILINNGQDAWVNINLPGFTGLATAGQPTLYPQSQDPRSNVPAPTLLSGDIWVETDSQPYPVIRKWNGSSWTLVNLTDQVTPNGIIFQDARSNPMYHHGSYTGQNNGGGSSPDLDPDAPQAALYPKGFMLWNTRFSTNNVKQWQSPFVYAGVTAAPDDTNGGSTGRWVNHSGNDVNGAPFMGAAAQHQVAVVAIQSVIVNNDAIRAEDMFYNLISAPGYVEAIDEMLALNDDIKDIAFVVGDTPMSLMASGTAIQTWATNGANTTTNNNTGLISASKYLGLWYPACLGTNTDGNNVVMPASHMALRTIAYNDQVAYPWFAPAGLQRGVVNNASSIGYINTVGQYVPTNLSNGLRDVLYTNAINPIREMPSGGIVIWGQKTKQPYASATDRINVVRLENYIRYQLGLLMLPFLFEPNDSITQKAVKAAVDSFFSELITLRAITDFITVCDSSNNTPARVARNELWLDISIVPTFAVEFVYIPIRITNATS